ncbi:MAG: hypothetical protein ACREID_02795, partial [Planctomycetota bacterium]
MPRAILKTPQPAMPQAVAETPAQLAPGVLPRTAPPLVLVVDSESGGARRLGEELAAAGLRTREAVGADGALRAAGEETPRLAVLVARASGSETLAC